MVEIVEHDLFFTGKGKNGEEERGNFVIKRVNFMKFKIK